MGVENRLELLFRPLYRFRHGSQYPIELISFKALCNYSPTLLRLFVCRKLYFWAVSGKDDRGVLGISYGTGPEWSDISTVVSLEPLPMISPLLVGD